MMKGRNAREMRAFIQCQAKAQSTRLLSALTSYAFLPTFPCKDKGSRHVPVEAQETHLLLRP